MAHLDVTWPTAQILKLLIIKFIRLLSTQCQEKFPWGQSSRVWRRLLASIWSRG